MEKYKKEKEKINMHAEWVLSQATLVKSRAQWRESIVCLYLAGRYQNDGYHVFHTKNIIINYEYGVTCMIDGYKGEIRYFMRC